MKNVKITLVLLALICCVCMNALAVPTGTATRSGTHFYVDGGVFYYAGVNCYDMFTMELADIDIRMAQMKADGVKVLRTWGFNHETWKGFEVTEGVYSEDEFMVFDYIMEAARINGIRIIITLENFWEAYGGIDTRLEWEGLPSGTYAARSVFFTNAGCKTQYKNYLAHFINRINSISGMAYKNDPVIFSWELMNEPRYQDATPNEDTTGTTLRAWIDEMGAYIKSLDSNHMVSLGIEGHESRYGFGGDEGNPFIYSHQSAYIDFCTAHPYPTEEWADLTLAETETLIAAWISDAHNSVGKPFVMEEFNVHKDKVDRSTWWDAMFNVLEVNDAAGSNFWCYEGRNTDSTFGVNTNSTEMSVFRAHSAVMSGKSTGGALPIDVPGFTFNAGDFQVTGYKEQDDGFHAYYYFYVTNNSSQGYQGATIFRIYATVESGTTMEAHYESSDTYIANPTVSGWTTSGSDTYYEINFGNRAISPGEKVGFKGGLALSGGGMLLSNDWSLSQLTTSSSVLTQTVVYIGGKVAVGTAPSGTTETPAPTTPPSDTTAPTVEPTIVTTVEPTTPPSDTPAPTLTPGPTSVPTATPVGVTADPTTPPSDTIAPTTPPAVTDAPVVTDVPTTPPAATDTPAGCTCANLCSSQVAITVPFTFDGTGEYCWTSSSLGTYVNSWNTDSVNINGTTCTNTYVSSSSIAAISGVYYIYCKSSYSWSHIEIK